MTSERKVKVRLPTGEIEQWDVVERLSEMDAVDPLRHKYRQLGIWEMDQIEPLLGYISDYVLGGDVSRWQGRMAWGTYKVAGGRFVIIRASFAGSDGGIFEDIEFTYNAENAPKDVEGVTYYHFFRADIDPVAQANFFADLVEDVFYNMSLMVDCETADGKIPKTVADNLEAFIAQLRIRLGVEVMLIYTRASFWNLYVEERAEWALHDLDIARYSDTLTHPWGDGTCKPRDWKNWRCWQFTSKGPGGVFGASSTYIDLQYFNGGDEEFAAYITPEEEEIMAKNIAVVKEVNLDATPAFLTFIVPEDTMWKLIAAQVLVTGHKLSAIQYRLIIDGVNVYLSHIGMGQAGRHTFIPKDIWLYSGDKFRVKAIPFEKPGSDTTVSLTVVVEEIQLYH